MDEEYYDSHCLINFMGHMWHIIGARPGLLQVVRLKGVEIVGTLIDTRNVDWEGYCKEAVELLYERNLFNVDKIDHQMDQ